MARYSREAVQRAVREGYLPPIVCALCGQRFWTEEQKRQHEGGVLNGWRICQHMPVAKPR